MKKSKEQIEGEKNLKRNKIFENFCENDSILQLYESQKIELENKGDTLSETYKNTCKQVKEIRANYWSTACMRSGAKD